MVASKKDVVVHKFGGASLDDGAAYRHAVAIVKGRPGADPVTGLWTEIFRVNLNNNAQFNFNGLTINFTAQPVDQVRLNSSPFQNQSYHNWNSLFIQLSTSSGGGGVLNPGNLVFDCLVQVVDGRRLWKCPEAVTGGIDEL